MIRNLFLILILVLLINLFFLTATFLPPTGQVGQAAPAVAINVSSLADTTGGWVCTLRDAFRTVNYHIGYGTSITRCVG